MTDDTDDAAQLAAWGREMAMADDAYMDGNEPPYVIRAPRGAAYRDGQPEDDVPEGWAVYTRNDLPRAGTQPAPDPVREAARALLAVLSRPENAFRLWAAVNESGAVAEETHAFLAALAREEPRHDD